MNYRSRMGFGHVRWPWWHDAIVVVVVLAVTKVALGG